MQTPICPRCGKSAWPSQQWMHKGCNVVLMVANVEKETPAVANRHGKYADTEKRKAYMRDLMRKRRASAKR